MAAPIYNVSPQMGSDLIIVVFAVVVIGGMGSIMGAILTGFALGIVEGLTKVFFPGGLQHRDLRHHGRRAAGPAGRPVRTERVMASARRAGYAGRTRRDTARSQAVAFAVMIAFFVVGAVRALSGLSDEGAVLCAVRLRLQSADRLCRPVVVRPRDVFRLGELPHGLCRQELGAAAGTRRSSSAPRRRRARRRSPA